MNAGCLSCPMHEVSKTNGYVKKSHVKKQIHRHSSLLQQMPYTFQNLVVLFLFLSMSVKHGAASSLPDVFNLDLNGESCQGGIVVSERSVDSTCPALCIGIKETRKEEVQRLVNQGTCYCVKLV